MDHRQTVVGMAVARLKVLIVVEKHARCLSAARRRDERIASRRRHLEIQNVLKLESVIGDAWIVGERIVGRRDNGTVSFDDQSNMLREEMTKLNHALTEVKT